MSLAEIDVIFFLQKILTIRYLSQNEIKRYVVKKITGKDFWCWILFSSSTTNDSVAWAVMKTDISEEQLSSKASITPQVNLLFNNVDSKTEQQPSQSLIYDPIEKTRKYKECLWLCPFFNSINCNFYRLWFTYL